MSTPVAEPPSRQALRERLVAARSAWRAEAPEADAAVASVLRDVLRQLEPEVLGTYWPIRAEFNASVSLQADEALRKLPLALPFAERDPPRMHYRRWDGRAPALRDGCGIPTCEGAPVVPDVVLVPCVGFTAEGFRLGYGGGFFDRWLAAHPGVTAVGLAWAASEIARAEFAPAPHDRPLDIVVTERGVRG